MPLTKKLEFCCLQPRLPVFGVGGKGSLLLSLSNTLKMELQDPDL